MKISRMLLLRAWLETRYRLLFPVGMFLLIAMLAHSTGSLRPRGLGLVAQPGSPFQAMMLTVPIFLLIAPVFLAGSGIRTQSGGVRATRGIHGSVYFTLSLPVSRIRLLAVRAVLGYLESIAIVGLICLALPWIIPGAPAFSLDFVRYWLTIVVCGSAYYALSLLLSTFLDDAWQIQAGIVSLFLSMWLFNAQPVPDNLNLFHAMGTASPLFTHTLPWATMGFSAAIACVLLAVSWWIVQSSEY